MNATVLIYVISAITIFYTFTIGAYVYCDAKHRGMNAILWAIVAALVPPLVGLLIYLLVRGNYSNLRCPRCDTPVNEQFVVCPKCGVKLRPSCLNCATPVEPDWKLCPKCTQPLTEYRTDICAPVKPKDRSIWKVLAIVLIVPTLMIALLVFEMSQSGGSVSIRATTISEYYEEMEEYDNSEIAKKVKRLAGDDLETDFAYVIQYTYESKNGNQHFLLVYVPGVGKQPNPGIGESSSIFGTTLTLDLKSTSGQGVLFNIQYSADEAPNLKIKLDGEKILYTMIIVDYNPTLYYIVPKYDELDPGATEFFMPERISVVKCINNHNEGIVGITDEEDALKILAGIDSAPYLGHEHDIYGKPDGSGEYDFKDGFDIIIEYRIHEDLIMHPDMLQCLVFEQDGGYYIINERGGYACNIRETDEEFYNWLSSLFE